MMFFRCVTVRRLLIGLFSITALLTGSNDTMSAQDNADDELLGLITEWLTGSDVDLRTLALEQVRTEAKGAAATQRFATLLPTLPADGQVGLLQALAERRDGAARPAVLDVLKSEHESVRVAALRCLGDLGTSEDFPRLVERLKNGSEAERTMAVASLVRLPGDDVPKLFVDQIAASKEPTTQVKLINIVVERRAASVVPALLELGSNPDLSVRQAALAAVGQLGSPEHIANLVTALLATKANQREWPEKAILAIYNRHPELAKQSIHPLLEAFFELSGDEQAAVLPAIGRVGGTRAREVVDWYLKHPYPFVSEVGWRALSLWPDASVAPELLAAVEQPVSDQRRAMAFKALVRVAGLADESRDVLQRLDWLKAAARMAKNDDERRLVLKRLSAVRHVDSLRFAMDFVEQPTLTEQACQAIVELAHLRWLRDEFKDEFMAALDRVQTTSRDPVVQERAQRYKEGKTWTGPGVGP